ncbi:MAG: hypothetical protein J6P16_03310, partial [Eubacterium sp.]|nr:hypothetical protein [Eubacterium sp.]
SKTFSEITLTNPKDAEYEEAETAISALTFANGFEFDDNQTSAPTADAVKALIEEDTGISAIESAVVGDVTVTEAEIWTVAGGETKVSFSVSKSGYSKTFSEIKLTNPADI